VAQAYKPAPQAYLRTAETLMLNPDQLCLVAAHNDDLAAARRSGLRTAFIPRPMEHGPHQTTDLKPEDDWDAVASGIDDLARRLDL
jgi:2-haloacid dehalogenase